MHPAETFQLTIECDGTNELSKASVKACVRDWLIGMGEESFVDGAVDDLYLDLDHDASALEEFDRLGGDTQPISVFKYDLEYLTELKSSLELSFGKQVKCSVTSSFTQDWMEGWKESFKPLYTNQFYVYPPWIAESLPSGLIPIEIEPGMAFGTGQHATTFLCLEAFDFLDSRAAKNSLLDVGTGTGILAIAAKKAGFIEVTATDVDPDSIIATRENSRVNGVSLELVEGSIPQYELKYDVVFANIIFYVLRKLINSLAEKTNEGGYLVLSGLLQEESQQMEELARVCGLSLLNVEVREDWICQIYRKNLP